MLTWNFKKKNPVATHFLSLISLFPVVKLLFVDAGVLLWGSPGGGGGVLVPLFPSIFPLCSHVTAAFPYLFPITYWFTTYPLPLIPFCTHVPGCRSASLVSLYWIVWIADDSIGSLQLDLVHLHYYKDTNSNIVKIKEKRPFSAHSDSEKTPSCNFPIRWTWSMNKK